MITDAKRLWKEAEEGEVAVACPVCTGSHFEVLLDPGEVNREREWLRRFYGDRAGGNEKDLSDFTQEEDTFVVSCLDCGTVLRNPRPAARELDRRYRHDRYGRRTLEQLLDFEREFFRAKAAAFDLPPGARILEVGCFVGAFLLAAKERGWQAMGLDIGSETVRFCRSLGLDVAPAGLDSFGTSDRFDAVFVWNTFDQLPQPRSALERIRELLKPGGRLVLRVPNGRFETVALKLRQTRPRVWPAMAYNNFLTFPYLVGYTPSSLGRMLGEEGFRLTAITGDTLLPLHLSEDAAAEERRYKRAVMRACALDERLGRGST